MPYSGLPRLDRVSKDGIWVQLRIVVAKYSGDPLERLVVCFYDPNVIVTVDL